MVSQQPQIHMEDEFIQDEELAGDLAEQIEIVNANRESAKLHAAARRRIKNLIRWDGEDHRYRIGENVIEVRRRDGGREVSYVTQDHFALRINPDSESA